MKLLKPENKHGYSAEEIHKIFKDKTPKFWKWFNGQTGIIIKGKLLIYQHDVQRFFNYLGVE